MQNTTQGPKKANTSPGYSQMSSQEILNSLVGQQTPRFQMRQLAPTTLLADKTNIEVFREMTEIADHSTFQNSLWDLFSMAVCSKRFSKLDPKTKQDLIFDYRNISQMITASFVEALHRPE